MAKQKFDIIQSTCIPIQIDNCNTDLIIPARYLASTTRDPQFFGDAFMHDLRFDAEGNPVADFVMNKPEYSEQPTEHGTTTSTFPRPRFQRTDLRIQIQKCPQ